MSPMLKASFLALVLCSAPCFGKDAEYKIEVLGSEFQIPWAMEFVDSDTLLINEKRGALYKYRLSTQTKTEIKGLPAILVEGQGGLLDIAQYKMNPDDWYFFTYTKSTSKGAITVLALSLIHI